MKYLLLILTLITVSCNAQIVSLETAAQCPNDPDNCPDYTYAKDINNSLDKYIGTWKGSHDGKTYEVQFKKGLYQDLTLSELKRDELVGRIKITSLTGNIPNTIFDNFSELDDLKTKFSGLNFSSNLQSYRMYFSGDSPTGCINYGTVYLTIKPATPTKLDIFFAGDYDIVEGECPSTFKTTFPEKQNIILTKQ